MIVSGFNLGVAGLFGTNFWMEIISSSVIFIATGLLYLLSFFHLFRQWNSNDQKLF